MNFDTSPAFSLPKSTRKTLFQINQSDNSPGPIYDTSCLNKKFSTSSFSIGKSSRAQINHGVLNTPGPLDYNPQKIKIINKKSHNIKQTIPQSQRILNKNYQQYSVDPAYYDVKYEKVMKNVQVFSMGEKYPSVLDDNRNTPGVGDYEINNNTITNNNKNKFGTSSRFINNGKLNLPGPGDYQLLTIHPNNNTKSKTSTTFGTSHKKKNNDYNQTPGPNQYNKPSLFQQAIKNKLGKSISGQLKQPENLQKQLTSKAFGSYNIDDQYKNTIPRSSSFTIGKGKRPKIQHDDIPGPTDYICDNYEHKNTFNATMPLSQRKQKIDNIHNPGPGTYEHIVSQSKSKIYTIPRSKSTNLIQPNPGVGRYNVNINGDFNNISNNNKGIKFKSSKRTDFVSDNVAGVGDYNVWKNSLKDITIAKAERFMNKKNHKPGPGDYFIPSSIGKFNNYGKPKYTN